MVALLLLAFGPACTGSAGKPADDTGDTLETGDTTDTAPDTDTADTDTSGGDSDTDTSPPPDADGDGHGDAAYGGDDCDDTRRWVFPGAEEWCDNVDQDCDGDPLAPGVCAEPQDARKAGVTLLSYTWPDTHVSDYAVLPDLDGDGATELLVACWDYCGYSQRSYQLLPGGIPAEPMTPPDDNRETWILQTGEYGGSYAQRAGDVNGDGIEDIAVELNAGPPGIYVYYGPFALDGSLHYPTDDADTWLYRRLTSDIDEWGYPYVSNVDWDGDGRTDFAAAPPSSTDEGVAADIFLGGMASGEGVRLLGGAVQPVSLGDLDGDGLPELRVQTSNADYGWVSGAMLATADSQQVDDLVEGTFDTYRSEPGFHSLGVAWAPIGDWDEDGYPDLAIASPYVHADSDATADVLFFGGDLRGYHTFDDALGWMTSGEGCTSAVHCADELVAVDFDGDGVLDLATDGITREDGASTLYVYPGSRGIPAPGTELDTSMLRWPTSQQRLVVGDLNGDGYGDLIGDFDSLGLTSAMLGWAVPWDDPTWW